ncbi:relaxin receptor 1 [Trichonephila clavipes]|nr:relaxin receptor 1 [Trichonephila clavipes]
MILRICVWLVAGLACLGNACVIIGRTLVKETNRVHSFYIKNLAVADFLMSLYLFVIAGHDTAYRGEYIRHDLDQGTPNPFRVKETFTIVEPSPVCTVPYSQLESTG